MAHVVAQAIDLGDINSVVDPKDLSWWDAVFAIVALVVGYVLARWARRAARKFAASVDNMPEALINTSGTLAFWAVLSTAIVVALSILGFDTAPVVVLLLIAVVVAVLIGRSLLENFGAGLVLQLRSPFEIGDQIETTSHTGEVIEINGRTVVIRTMDGMIVHIPNFTVISNPIVNLTVEGKRRTRLDVGVEYGTDLALAHRVMLEATTSVAPVMDEPAPEVFVTEFGDSSIDFAVRFWHEPQIRQGFVVTDQVARAIDTALKEQDIVIAFPQTTLWWGDPDSTPTVPPPS